MSSALLLVVLLSFWGELEPGPYGVGFELVRLRDYSRPFYDTGNDRARPITLSIWYPADVTEDDVPLELRRYVPDDDRGELATRLRASGHRLSGSELDHVLASPTRAFEGAARAKGPFPLLVFGTGLMAHAYLNTVLCEYLASRGYVVVAVPSLPMREDVRLDYDALAVETQIRDMEFAIHWMHDYPETDIEELGLVAWSLGGVSQALLQMKNADVDAVVSLDAATGYRYGWELLQSSLYYEPSRASASFFHLTDSRESTSRAPKSFDYFDGVLRGTKYFLTIEGMAHAEFTSLASAIAPTSADARKRYELLCRYVQNFLDQEMKSDAQAAEFLDVAPTRHGFQGLVLSREP